jgi:glucose-6-phosphate isomerase
LFAGDAQRAQSLSLSFDDILFDFSKQRLTSETLGLLVALAREARLAESITRMFAGERINVSEGRSVLHVALRRFTGPFPRSDFDVMPEVLETRRRMAEFAERLRSGECLGYTGLPIRDVVNIGIGGSDLGPKMMCSALRAISHPTLAIWPRCCRRWTRGRRCLSSSARPWRRRKRRSMRRPRATGCWPICATMRRSLRTLSR